MDSLLLCGVGALPDSSVWQPPHVMLGLKKRRSCYKGLAWHMHM